MGKRNSNVVLRVRIIKINNMYCIDITITVDIETSYV